MIALLLLLAPPVMPPADDGPPNVEHLDHFPNRWAASDQIDRCKEHLDRLRWLRCYHGDTDQFRGWIRETEWRLRYWQLLSLAHDTDFSEDFHRARMYDLWFHVGPARYDRRWSPPQLPEGMLPRPRKEPDCPGG